MRNSTDMRCHATKGAHQTWFGFFSGERHNAGHPCFLKGDTNWCTTAGSTHGSVKSAFTYSIDMLLFVAAGFVEKFFQFIFFKLHVIFLLKSQHVTS